MNSIGESDLDEQVIVVMEQKTLIAVILQRLGSLENCEPQKDLMQEYGIINTAEKV